MRRFSMVRRGALLLLALLALGLLAEGCGDDGEFTTTEPGVTTSETTPEAAPTSAQQGTDAAGSTVQPGSVAEDASTVATDTPTTVDTAATDASTDTPPDTADVNTGGGSSTAAAETAPIMLTVDDLPSGYGEKPYESENADCLGPALDGMAAQVYPPNAFEAESVVGEARSRAWTFASPEEAEAAFATAIGDEVEACILAGAEKDLQTEDYEPGGTAETQELELEALEGADEQDSTTYAATFTPAGGDGELTAYSNLILVRSGDTVAAYQFLTLEQPFSPADQQKAVAAAVARHASSA